MTLEEAIKTALEYETKVRDAYVTATEKSADDVGRRIFRALADEEQGHIDYLKSRLSEWQTSGQVTHQNLDTIVPPEEKIAEGVSKLDQTMSAADKGSEIELLSKALRMEVETSGFYQRMVDELGDEGELFARFLEIEKGHQAIVQAEIDYLTRTGYFFDFQDFGMV
jgi:rubrerythrin